MSRARFTIVGMLAPVVACLHLRLQARDGDASSGSGSLQLSRAVDLCRQKESDEVGVGDFCVICLEGFESETENPRQGIHGCTHAFHLQCIKQWAERDTTCPICRFDFETQFGPVPVRSDDGAGLTEIELEENPLPPPLSRVVRDTVLFVGILYVVMYVYRYFPQLSWRPAAPQVHQNLNNYHSCSGLVVIMVPTYSAIPGV